MPGNRWKNKCLNLNNLQESYHIKVYRIWWNELKFNKTKKKLLQNYILLNYSIISLFNLPTI